MCVFYMQKWLLAVVTILVLAEAENTVMGPWSLFILHACIPGVYNGIVSEKKRDVFCPREHCNPVDDANGIIWVMGD